MKISAIVFEHGKDDFELWSEFSLSKEDEDKIMSILNKYDTDGFSVRGNMAVNIKSVYDEE